MKPWAMGSAALILGLAIGAGALASWHDSKTEPLEGGYILYGGDLGDWSAPKAGEPRSISKSAVHSASRCSI